MNGLSRGIQNKNRAYGMRKMEINAQNTMKYTSERTIKRVKYSTDRTKQTGPTDLGMCLPYFTPPQSMKEEILFHSDNR